MIHVERNGSLPHCLGQDTMVKHKTDIRVMASENVCRRPDVAYNATVEEIGYSEGSTDLRRKYYEDLGSTAVARSPTSDATGHPRGINLRKTMNAATWNVRSLNTGKLEMVINEINNYGINLLGATKIKSKRQGHFSPKKSILGAFSGGDQVRGEGVALILCKQCSTSLLGYNPNNSRIITVRLKCRPVNITVLLTYAPTSVASDVDIDYYYEKLQTTVHMVPTSSKDILVLMGDFNAEVGKASSSSLEYGKFGLGTRHESGEILTEFCKYNKLVICNSCFQTASKNTLHLDIPR